MSLEGTLQDMPLTDLLEVFHLDRKSGILQLFAPAQRASLYVTMGRVIDAVVVQQPHQQLIACGDEAIAQVFNWEEAQFVFKPDRSTLYRPVTIFRDAEDLVQLGPVRPSASKSFPMASITSPIKVDCTFSHDLSTFGPASERFDNQYRRMRLSATRVISAGQPCPSTQQRFELCPCEEGLELAFGAQTSRPAPAAQPAKQPTMSAPAAPAQYVGSTPAGAPQPSRRLMQAILRRVRSL